MKTNKLSLDAFKVKSFTTSLNNNEKKNMKGGACEYEIVTVNVGNCYLATAC